MLRKKPSPESVLSPRPLAIVVADDVADIRQLIAHWLGELGHVVTAAASGRELLKLLEGQSFDLVITDIVMPDGDGHDVIAAVTRLRPGTRVLAISGGGQHMPTDAGLRIAKGLGADGMITKPFTKEQLLRAVEQAIRR
jgi:CheY-like chemotaxis protein